MDVQISERKIQLHKKALELQNLLEEYYRSMGKDPHPRGLVWLFGKIAGLLLKVAISPLELRESSFGIFRILTDQFELERSELGKTLLDFGEELEKLADMLERKE